MGTLFNYVGKNGLFGMENGYYAGRMGYYLKTSLQYSRRHFHFNPLSLRRAAAFS